MFSEIMVAIKDEEKTLRTKYIIYETYQADENDPIIKDCIEKTLENFDGTPDSIKVTITLEIQ